MEFRLLGPVEVRAGTRVLPVGRPQQRLLVAALAVDAGRPVMVDTLVDRVWDEAPAGAQRTLYVLVSRLRGVLELARAGGSALVARRAGGYALEVAPAQVDLLRSRSLVAQARQATYSVAGRLLPLREAVRAWRGEPLSGLAGEWAARTRQSLRLEHIEVAVAWARAELAGGDPAAVVGPLVELVGAHPLAESLAEALMAALCATGRPAEALCWYEATRRRLVDELGADPGPALRAAHQRILRGRHGVPR